MQPAPESKDLTPLLSLSLPLSLMCGHCCSRASLRRCRAICCALRTPSVTSEAILRTPLKLYQLNSYPQKPFPPPHQAGRSSELEARVAQNTAHQVPMWSLGVPLLIFLSILCASLALNRNASWLAESVYEDHYVLSWHSTDAEAWRIVGGLLCGALSTALSSAGGIGGGGLYVPIFNLILGFNSKTSAALSSCMIVGGTLVNIIWYSFQKDATGRGPLVDYQVVLLCLPNVLLGISAGVMCNVASPSWLVTVLLIVVLFFMTFRSCRGAFQRWNIESSCLVQSQHLISKPSLTNDNASSDKTAFEDTLRSSFCGSNDSLLQEHHKSCKTEDLEMPLLSPQTYVQPQFPWSKIVTLCTIWIAFLAVQLVRGSTDGQLPLAVIVTASMLLHLQRNSKKQTGTSASQEMASQMESGSMMLLPIYALVAGFLGGMLGLGGGMIISPLFLEMGMHPQVTAATCSYMVFFSSSLSVIQFWLLGRIPQVFALASASLALVFSVIGLSVIHTVISKYGRVSLIVFSVSTVMGISAAMMAFFGSWDVIAQIEQHAYMGFRSPC